jgi:hypothetical protein
MARQHVMNSTGKLEQEEISMAGEAQLEQRIAAGWLIIASGFATSRQGHAGLRA